MTETWSPAKARMMSSRVYFCLDSTDTCDGGIDLVAVERAVAGELPLPRLTPEEQRRAALVLTRLGASIRVTAERLGLEQRIVTRWRASWRAAR
ncbi:hypothetical protein [Streptomyces luteireticuli]|uniref:hypothetical protein n=1 Tax=Streptomyces luteireticuli TaxID=173858 RepID=UPI0035570AB2